MIKQEVVDKIIDAARIEEVVGEFVDLKKRGISLIGLCPFHNEKTPSFNVSVSRGIYKCFGCGAGGDAVRFIMEHEKYSYPEALRYLAAKYHIEVEETEQTDEQVQQRDHRESLMIVTNWAGSFFAETLWDTEEGQTVGLNYFRERGYRDDTIHKFGLGYAPDSWSALLDRAHAAGYRDDYLAETGLIVQKEDGGAYDRFRGRVMFPIHNLTGRILGFGGRTLLSKDKKTPKYVNSPESAIYHKSNVLYGLYFAKKAISQADKCFLVEGYADVIAMHQAGVENVVSSSGTSLTEGQIKLIRRYTTQVTLLYDGDAAGVQASLRGMDMLLAEGMDVQIVLFPEGDDPDSYIKKHGSSAFGQYLQEQEEDFITFKTNVLVKKAGTDPLARANTIREVVESIALIPNEIKVSVFIQECSRLLDIEERVLLHELNKIRVDENRKKRQSAARPDSGIQAGARGSTYPHATDGGAVLPPGTFPFQPESELGPASGQDTSPIELQEKEFVRVLLNYGHSPADWMEDPELPIAPLLINSIGEVPFTHPVCAKIIEIYSGYVNQEKLPEDRVFTSHPDEAIAHLAISLLSPKYALSPNWNDEKRKIYVPEEKENLEELVYTSVYRIKKRWIEGQMNAIRDELKQETDDENTMILLSRYQSMKEALKLIGEKLGTIVLK